MTRTILQDVAAVWAESMNKPHDEGNRMASTNKNDTDWHYKIEPSTTEETVSESDEMLTESMVVRNLEPVERRVYYVRGQKGEERVVATIRSRSRRRAIEIAASQGIKVDKKDLVND